MPSEERVYATVHWSIRKSFWHNELLEFRRRRTILRSRAETLDYAFGAPPDIARVGAVDGSTESADLVDQCGPARLSPGAGQPVARAARRARAPRCARRADNSSARHARQSIA